MHILPTPFGIPINKLTVNIRYSNLSYYLTKPQIQNTTLKLIEHPVQRYITHNNNLHTTAPYNSLLLSLDSMQCGAVVAARDETSLHITATTL